MPAVRCARFHAVGEADYVRLTPISVGLRRSRMHHLVTQSGEPKCND